MLTIYEKNIEGLLKSRESIEVPLWVDLFEPTEEEIKNVEQRFLVKLPPHSKLHDIELSNRFYEEENTCFLTATITTKVETDNPETHVMLFVIIQNVLITLRYSDPTPILNLIRRIDTNHVYVADASDMLFHIIEAMIGRIADLLQTIGKKSEFLSKVIINSVKEGKAKSENQSLSKCLCDINQHENLLSKSYQSLISFQLLLDFMQQSSVTKPTEEISKKTFVVEKDIKALIAQSDFLSQKLEFLLNSALGMINIKQNNIIKMFTVLAMIFMPPTLIASLYGMNFHFMPELNWIFGYPLAIVMMVLSSFIPYKFFKHKGWI